MKNNLIRAILLLFYCIPFVFLAMNEDAATGTLWFYIIMTAGFVTLCYGSIKSKNSWIVTAGNILSFISSCIFTFFFKSEKWDWYFKPFTPYQIIIFETLLAFAIQIIFIMYNARKKEKKI